MMQIRSYWEGQQPEIVSHCHDRFVAMYGDRFQLIDRWQDEWGPEPKGLAVYHRADLAKWELLHRHGGIVVDLDCVPLRDFAELVTGLTFFTDQGMQDVGFMAAEVGDPTISYFREAAWSKYYHGLTKHYTALGKHITCSVPLVAESNEPIMPIHWSDQESFHASGREEQHLAKFDDQAYCYMLNRGVTAQPLKLDSFLAWLLARPVAEVSNGNHLHQNA